MNYVFLNRTQNLYFQHLAQISPWNDVVHSFIKC